MEGKVSIYRGKDDVNAAFKHRKRCWGEEGLLDWLNAGFGKDPRNPIMQTLPREKGEEGLEVDACSVSCSWVNYDSNMFSGGVVKGRVGGVMHEGWPPFSVEAETG